jgi:hypothetical protein
LTGDVQGFVGTATTNPDHKGNWTLTLLEMSRRIKLSPHMISGAIGSLGGPTIDALFAVLKRFDESNFFQLFRVCPLLTRVIALAYFTWTKKFALS